MTSTTIQEMLDAEPFEPFRICLSNGTRYEVHNPHMVALMKAKVFVAAANSERWAFVSYLHIAALEASKNGHARVTRRRRPRK